MNKKINFEKIGTALNVFDTDKMDISRRMEIQNPDGTTGETSGLTPLYKDVYCHIGFIKADNPDASTADTQPILQGLQINCNSSVDLQNGDYITAYKLDSNENILETYKGIIGQPEVSQSRKSALMKMETSG